MGSFGFSAAGAIDHRDNVLESFACQLPMPLLHV